MEHGARYTARTKDLAVQQLGDELLIYDRARDVAHCLTQPAATVWRACEGEGATLEELTKLTAESADVERALAELEEKGLLAETPGGAVSRRHALLKIAGVGAGALAAPLIVSAAVPKSAEAFKSPSTCVAIGSSCTVSPGQSNSYGSSPMNTCCGPGVKTCNVGTSGGEGGCYCNSQGVCANCTKSGANPSGTTCGHGVCNKATRGLANACCCSGFCAAGANLCM